MSGRSNTGWVEGRRNPWLVVREAVPVGLTALLPFLFLVSESHAQRVPDPNVGNEIYKKTGIMDGNRVRTKFYNHGEVADWPTQPSGEWPIGSGHSYVDGVALVVSVSTSDTNGHTIHPMETMYREFIDVGSDGTLWGWAPLPGYFNPSQSSPAMSDDSNTWPSFWPDRPLNWGGFWNGYFGKGVRNADLETYFVFDDDPDEEWGFFPDSTDLSRRGLGLEVGARGFQWSHVLAEDCIFWHYAITNEATTDYDSVYFTFYIDWGVGGTNNSADDNGSYDTKLDLAYAWDDDFNGDWGSDPPPGYCGFAFLESPGIGADMIDGVLRSGDGIDNDEDATMRLIDQNGNEIEVYNPWLIDESRQSGPGTYDASAGHVVNGVWYPELGSWSGDEDKDWDTFTDANGNGAWDSGEPLNDDLGGDGIGPLDEGYDLPDEGEGDGIPTAGEPDFDATDKDESDQLGLTGFRIFPLHTYELWDDEQDWNVFRSAPTPKNQLLTRVNLGMFFSSGPFPLKAGQTERFSMALLFGEDLADLERNKETVQVIYNANYNFARPPLKPTLDVVPGDNVVTLYWDDAAERSYDRALQKYDFEGYLIYRSTEPYFLEPRVITDSYGNLTYNKPIAQFDLIDGIKGPHPVTFQGVGFNMGNDTGLKHVWRDTTVKNGQTYYYAVVSYDQGDPDYGTIGLLPSWSTSVIREENGELWFDINTAVATPNAPAPGYRPARVEGEILHTSGPGTGQVSVDIVDYRLVKEDHTYEVMFEDDGEFVRRPANYSVFDITDPIIRDTLVYKTEAINPGDEGPIFDGMRVFVNDDKTIQIIDSISGWSEGSETNFVADLGKWGQSTDIAFPTDIEVRFYDTFVDSSWRLAPRATNIHVYDATEKIFLKFVFRDNDNNNWATAGDEIIPVIEDSTLRFGYVTLWRVRLKDPPDIYDTTWVTSDSFYVDTTRVDPIVPTLGDTVIIRTTKPFRSGDVFHFTTKEALVEQKTAEQGLDDIIVVPNPYVVAATWEPANPYTFGRGERRIWFMNLPSKCTIRIYTLRGYLVDTIHHDSPELSGAESWDLISKDGMEIAYGIYLYHIEAPGLGEKIGKFAVIK